MRGEAAAGELAPGEPEHHTIRCQHDRDDALEVVELGPLKHETLFDLGIDAVEMRRWRIARIIHNAVITDAVFGRQLCPLGHNFGRLGDW